ncbi:reverse transcriptase domain-containing protein [Tanacetum coccineum]
MHTRASNSELVEPLSEPERTLNRRLRRRNRRVPFERRDERLKQQRVIYLPILDINYFSHFINIVKNYNPIDDEPMWAADRVVAPTPSFAITIPETANEFAIKDTFMDLKTKLETTTKNHQALIQNLEAKFDRFADKQYARPSGSLPSNTQLNPKEKMEAKYGKFLDMIRAVGINIPLVDVLAGMPNYDKFLKELVRNKHKLEQISSAFLSDESSAMIQNKVPPKLGDPETKNMLVKVGKFTFLVDFVILKMKEDSKVPVILGRPFLHIADAVIQVKQKQLKLGVGTERMTFSIDSAMKHSYSNDDTCFSIDVIEEILEEDFDALLDEGSSILYSIEETIHEEKLFAEFNEFMAMTIEEKSEIESDEEKPTFKKITFNTDYKIKTSLKEPPSDLELKPLPEHLEYVFLEEPSFLPMIISSQISEQNKNKLIYVLKRHKQDVAWKITNIPGIYLRMPFGLCNAPATFQRCMLAIFHDMIEESVEVFMDDFSVFGNSFNNYLNNLDKMLQHCKDANLVLNWEKCHFMVKEGIVLGHKVSGAGLEVDKAKIDLLEKDTPFEFNDECHKAFNLLKEKLTCTPVIVSPNWNLPFELMCDASEFAFGAVLGQKYEFDIKIKDKKGTENDAADHLSRIENDETSDDNEVDDNFPRETLMEITTRNIPWFADFANYLVDGMIRCCVVGPETRTILDQCHHRPTGGHYGPTTTVKRVLDSGFYWPTIIKEAHTLVRLCEARQKTRNISKRDEMPLNSIQVCEVFDVTPRIRRKLKA